MRTVSRMTGLTLITAGFALVAGSTASSQAKPAAAPAKKADAAMEKQQDMATMKGMMMVSAKSLKWGPLVAPGFDPGAEMTVVSGDPGSTGAYTLRLKFPAGYKFPAHWHPNAENLTVLSGTLNLGMGDHWDDAKLQKYRTGDFFWVDGKNPHFGGVDVPTVIQLHGIGPFAIELAKPMK